MQSQILILDDDIEFRDFLTAALMNAGHEVIMVGRYEQALGLTRNIPFDLLIVDGHLPDGNGVDFIANVRQHDTSVKIIFLSAFSAYFEGGTTRELLLNSLGVSKMLKKPIDPESFLQGVNDTLRASPPTNMLKNNTPPKTEATQSQPSIDQQVVESFSQNDTASISSSLSIGSLSSVLGPSPVLDTAEHQPLLKPNFELQLEELKKAGIETTRERLSKLQDILLSSREALSVEKFTEAHALAHKIHGSAGTFGFGEVSQAAAKIELLLQELLSGASYHPLVLTSLEQFVEEAFSHLIQAPQPLWTASTEDQELEEPVCREQPSNVQSNEKESLLRTPQGLHGKLLFLSLTTEQRSLARQICVPHDMQALFAEKPEDVDEILEKNDIDALFLRLYTGDEKAEPVQENVRDYLSKSMYVIPHSVRLAHKLRTKKKHAKIPIIFFSEEALLEDRILAAHTSDLFLKESAFGLELVRFLQTLLKQAQNKARILLIDEEPEGSLSLQSLLHGDGYEVLLLNTPEGILEKLTEFEPDLLLIGFNLPKINGLDLCRVLRAMPKWRYIPIFISAHEEISTLPRASLDAGADQFVSKGEPLEQIVKHIRNRLRLL